MSIWVDYQGRCGDCGYRKCQCHLIAPKTKPGWDTRTESAFEMWLDDPVYRRKPVEISERKARE